MDKKKLEERAITIGSKKYVLVADRILFFNEKYPNGCIQSTAQDITQDIIRVKAYVYPDMENDDRFFTGMSESVRGGKGIEGQSTIEVTETSAVGRALAMMGIGVLDSVASADEMRKAGADGDEKATDKQLEYLDNLVINKKGMLPDNFYDNELKVDREKLTKEMASAVINKMIPMPDKKQKNAK